MARDDPKLTQIKQHLGAGMAITHDNRLIRVPTSRAQRVVEWQGQGYAPNPPAWHPTRRPTRKEEEEFVPPFLTPSQFFWGAWRPAHPDWNGYDTGPESLPAMTTADIFTPGTLVKVQDFYPLCVLFHCPSVVTDFYTIELEFQHDGDWRGMEPTIHYNDLAWTRRIWVDNGITCWWAKAESAIITYADYQAYQEPPYNYDLPEGLGPDDFWITDEGDWKDPYKLNFYLYPYEGGSLAFDDKFYFRYGYNWEYSIFEIEHTFDEMLEALVDDPKKPWPEDFYEYSPTLAMTFPASWWWGTHLCSYSQQKYAVDVTLENEEWHDPDDRYACTITMHIGLVT